jgi:4-amino-4-deoxy-L-arabinose transferase-like glycosyltransferase
VLLTSGAVLVVTTPAVALRLVHLNTLGLNSDEAVYAGQAASLAGNTDFQPFFPVFRAHPLLFQALLAAPYRIWGVSPEIGRALAAAFGLGTIALVYLIGRLLYNRATGFIAALLLAVMPYHVIVSRQILLDGPMAFFATLGLYLVARYADSGRPVWVYAAGGAMGLSFLSKESAILLLAGVYAFFALTRTLKVRIRDLAIAMLVFVIVIIPYPASMKYSGKASTGGHFLTWQLFRRPNHDWTFYPTTLLFAIGVLVLVAAGLGLWLCRREWSWRETLLLCWIAGPALFFELWAVKGYQYLLPIAMPITVLAARALVGLVGVLRNRYSNRRASLLAALATVIVVGSLGVPSWNKTQPAQAGTTFLAGTGGVPGGRAAGEWVAMNVPKGGELLALGPSMANIMQFYGKHRTYGLSVSPNPLRRNPVYEPVQNPDLLIRHGDLQYIVWDSYSASRSPFFSKHLMNYVERYHGVVVHQEAVTITTEAGHHVEKPVIVIYQVRP